MCTQNRNIVHLILNYIKHSMLGRVRIWQGPGQHNFIEAHVHYFFKKWGLLKNGAWGSCPACSASFYPPLIVCIKSVYMYHSYVMWEPELRSNHYTKATQELKLGHQEYVMFVSHILGFGYLMIEWELESRSSHS